MNLVAVGYLTHVRVLIIYRSFGIGKNVKDPSGNWIRNPGIQDRFLPFSEISKPYSWRGASAPLPVRFLEYSSYNI